MILLSSEKINIIIQFLNFSSVNMQFHLPAIYILINAKAEVNILSLQVNKTAYKYLPK